jgi:hypothetical protein
VLNGQLVRQIHAEQPALRVQGQWTIQVRRRLGGIFGCGQGLVDSLTAGAGCSGIPILHNDRAVALVTDDTEITGVVARTDERKVAVKTRSTIRAPGKIRGQRRMAHALPGSGLGPGHGARNQVKHRGRHPSGIGRRPGISTSAEVINIRGDVIPGWMRAANSPCASSAPTIWIAQGSVGIGNGPYRRATSGRRSCGTACRLTLPTTEP